MFSVQLRAAIEAAPRTKLPELSGALWKAYRAGSLDDEEAQSLAELIEARKVVPVPAPKPVSVGSRPRSSASIERRRKQAASGWLPPQVAASFTLAEASALSIVAERIAKSGRCDMTVGEIAGRAGVSETTVRNALREARGQGLVTIEARRVRYDRNLPNVVRIVSEEWRTWIRLRAKSASKRPGQPMGGGCRTANPTSTHIHIRPPRPAPNGLEDGKSREKRTKGAAMPIGTIPISA